MKHWKDIRDIQPAGKTEWGDGAYTLAFVYSNKGNFLVRGYRREVSEYLKSLIDIGYRFFVNYRLYRRDVFGNSTSRGYWKFWKNTVLISAPSPEIEYDNGYISKRTGKWKKWEFYIVGNANKSLRFKRLPTRWIPDLDQL